MNTGNDSSYEAAADAALAQLNQLFQTAMSRNGLSQGDINDGPSGFTAVWQDVTGNGSRTAIAGSLKRDQGYLGKLAGDYRRWAEAGQRDDGTPYGWELWGSFAKDVGSDLQTQSGLAWDSSIVGPLWDAVVKTGQDVAADAGAVVDAAGSALDFLSSPLPWVGLAALVVLYVGWKVLK